MTISGVFLSVLSGTKLNGSAARHTVSGEPDPLERAVLHRCEIYRKSFPMTEIALPAYALRNLPVSKWARDQRLAIDVRTGKEFAVAIAAGIHPARMTVHADRLSDSELRATANLEPGRVVVSSMSQIELLASAVGPDAGRGDLRDGCKRAGADGQRARRSADSGSTQPNWIGQSRRCWPRSG